MYVWNIFRTDARVTREAQALAEDGWDVWVVAILDPTQPEPFEQRGAVKIVRVDSRSLRRSLPVSVNTSPSGKRSAGLERYFPFSSRLIVMMRHWLRFSVTAFRLAWVGWKLKADIYHCHDLNTAIPGVVSSRLHGSPVIYDSHEIHMDKHTRYTRLEMWLWGVIERCFMTRVARCVTTTRQRGRWLVRKYHIPDPVIIHNFAAYHPSKRRTVLHDILGVQHHTPIVLYQGGVQPHRGLEQIIEAVQWIDLKAMVVILGEGPLWDKIEQMIKSRGISRRVRMLPAVAYEQLWLYTASAAIGLQCLQNTCFNHYSTGSNKLFEYFMAGIPVVASDFPFIREVLTDTEAGILVHPHNPKEIAKAVNKLLRSDTYDIYSRNARQAAKKYNWDSEKEVLCNLYTDIEKKYLGRSNIVVSSSTTLESGDLTINS